jgi:hypothetical protein
MLRGTHSASTSPTVDQKLFVSSHHAVSRSNQSKKPIASNVVVDIVDFTFAPRTFSLVFDWNERNVLLHSFWIKLLSPYHEKKTHAFCPV